VREEDLDVELTIDELCTAILDKIEGYPNRPMYFPAEMSRRIV
jgi:hypothetical protein